MKKKYRHPLPKGWTLKDVQAVAKYYDKQSDEEGAAEIEAGGREDEAVIAVPLALMPRVTKIIQQHKSKRKTRLRPRHAA